MDKELAANSTLSHYRIVSKIGAGGMGEVYLAQDTRLDRKVALKILPAEVASNRDRMDRFVREAKSAAALSHPNIAQIFEIGEHDRTHFIAMEFVDGVTLRQKIHQERTELAKLLRYLQHVAEGLAKAHSAGIVHRDLKPDNIMITRDGHAKILDFGLAKLIGPQDRVPASSGGSSDIATAILLQHSTPGAVMGTVGYMSPEQAKGKVKEIDHRSDIFSFGCVLYEAVTRLKAFEGQDALDSLHRIVHAPTPLIKETNATAPEELQRIVRRCLAKDREDRYQTIKDVAIELRELRRDLEGAGVDTTMPPARSETTADPGAEIKTVRSDNAQTGSPPGSITAPVSSARYIVSGIKQHKFAVTIGATVLVLGFVALGLYLRARNTEVAIESIAVMPFVSGNADLEYLSDGMTETLISSLSQLPNLNVKARSSVFRYKGKDTSPQSIGKDLNVQAILNGRVVQRGEQLTLSLELIDAQTENVIWSERYNRKQADLVTLQSEIARDVSSKLKTKLSAADEQKLATNYTENTEAYKLYLKGRFQWNKRTGESLKQAVEHYNQAIERDPNYALAYAGLAESYIYYSLVSLASAQEIKPKVRAAAMRSLELDDSLAEAHLAFGLYLTYFDWNHPAAEREFRRAIELKPNYATAHHLLGADLLIVMKRFDEAIAAVRRAEELDPLSPLISADVGTCLLFARRYDEAISQLEYALTLDPNFNYTRWNLGAGYDFKGQYKEAIAEYRKALELDDDSWVSALLARALAKSGQRGEAVTLLNHLKSESTRTYVPSYGLALVYAALGEKDKAFILLEKDLTERSSVAHFYPVDPLIDDLRDDPRFKAMLKRLNLPE